jgi:hypothetical protein
MKSNHQKFFDLFSQWYSIAQMNEIWALLKDYDNQLMKQKKITDKQTTKDIKND